MKPFTTVHVPNAARMGPRDCPMDDARTLIAVICRTASGPNGERATLDDIARLLGISVNTLKDYRRRPRRDRSANQRGIPYTALYCLEVLASAPAATSAAIWGEA